MKKLDFFDMEALKVVIAWRWGKKILISLARRIFPRPFLLSCFSSFFSPAWWLFQDDPWHLVSPCPLDTHWDLIFRENSAKSVETIEVGGKKCCFGRAACRKQGRADNRAKQCPRGQLGTRDVQYLEKTHTQFFLSFSSSAFALENAFGTISGKSCNTIYNWHQFVDLPRKDSISFAVSLKLLVKGRWQCHPAKT